MIRGYFELRRLRLDAREFKRGYGWAVAERDIEKRSVVRILAEAGKQSGPFHSGAIKAVKTWA